MSEDDLRFFTDTVKQFFAVSTGVQASIAAAYLATGDVPTREFTGVISLSGAFRGHLLVSAPRLLLRDFLLKQGENDTSDANLLDAVGEIANTIAGNARAKFGEGLEISTPVKLRGGDGSRARIRKHPFLIALRWGAHEAMVCIDLERA
jgi:chemotaxis protein CheX